MKNQQDKVIGIFVLCSLVSVSVVFSSQVFSTVKGKLRSKKSSAQMKDLENEKKA